MKIKEKIRLGIFEATIILLVSSAIGMVFNHFYSKGIPLVPEKKTVQIDATDFDSDTTVEDTFGEPQIISLEQAHALFMTKSAIFIDARKADHYAYGHISGARLLAWRGLENPPEIPDDLNPDQLFVVYCSDPGCETAADLAFFLFDNGYHKIRIFEGGWEEWSLANLPTGKGSDQ